MQTTTDTERTERGFDQMGQGMKNALQDFEQTKSSDVFAEVINFLRPAADYGTQVWTKLVDYSRRHPVRMTVSAIALGLIIARMRKRV